ncbi:hydrogen peroxide-dependent heme synthase [Curtobacterium ammoniigenes]|uniref:hydrogen peroxide-dependent heme synthase n=1 Tax=Curtobacterium ammoniigenes TaxID=395387 RepID=UPI0009FA85B8|nr:hydrogen peroxide-dependent heme synthase [Curtobacterium ammoniigenes]
MSSSAPAPVPSTDAENAGVDLSLLTAYTLWAVFRRPSGRVERADDAAVAELDHLVADVATRDVTIRGFYDVSGLKADADVMIWLHGPDAAEIQAALRAIRRTALFADLEPVWHAMGTHRDAEFNKSHTPAFLRGVPPREWLTVYPFVRSYEWYLLPEAERRQMLADHGRQGAKFKRVLANTVASFALGDYEWILPLESPDPIDLVDLMRDLRYTEARRHVREEIPFYTGRRVTTAELPEVLS